MVIVQVSEFDCGPGFSRVKTLQLRYDNVRTCQRKGFSRYVESHD